MRLQHCVALQIAAPPSPQTAAFLPSSLHSPLHSSTSRVASTSPVALPNAGRASLSNISPRDGPASALEEGLAGSL